MKCEELLIIVRVCKNMPVNSVIQNSDNSFFSQRVKEAIKTGLSMALSCGIALALGWSNPCWACIAVLVVSMPSVGESINKGLHRLWGTVLGVTIALTIAVLFSQDRWAAIACMSLWMGYSAFKMTYSKYNYVWFMGGYVTLLVVTNITSSSQQIFDFAMLRLQETMLGIIVHTFITNIVWPQKSSKKLKIILLRILNLQRDAIDRYFKIMIGSQDQAKNDQMYSLEAQHILLLKRNLESAASESLEVYESRYLWKAVVRECESVMESLEIWKDSLKNFNGKLNIEVFKNAKSFFSSIEKRLDQISTLVRFENAYLPEKKILVLNDMVLAKLSIREQAVAINTQDVLNRLEEAVVNLGKSASQLSEIREQGLKSIKKIQEHVLGPDLDSYVTMVRVVIGIWAAALFWIYFDVPGHISFIIFVGVHLLLGIMIPQINWTNFFVAESCGVVLACFIYVFLLPIMSTYLELAILLFCVSASICYIFYHPQKATLKMCTIMPMLLLINIQPHQIFDFSIFINNMLAMLLSIVFAAATFTFPYIQSRDKIFLKFHKRYFKFAKKINCSICCKEKNAVDYDNVCYKINELHRTAFKTKSMVGALNPDFSHQNNVSLSSIARNLNNISYRFKLLLDVIHVNAITNESGIAIITNWKSSIDKILTGLCGEEFSNVYILQFQNKVFCLDNELNNLLNESDLTADMVEHELILRLVSAYRGLSLSLIAHIKLLLTIDWVEMRESRF